MQLEFDDPNHPALPDDSLTSINERQDDGEDSEGPQDRQLINLDAVSMNGLENNIIGPATPRREGSPVDQHMSGQTNRQDNTRHSRAARSRDAAAITQRLARVYESENESAAEEDDF